MDQTAQTSEFGRSPQEKQVTEKQLELGQVAYDAYCASTGGVSLISGDKLPEFRVLKSCIQDAWVKAANAAATAAMTEWFRPLELVHAMGRSPEEAVAMTLLGKSCRGCSDSFDMAMQACAERVKDTGDYSIRLFEVIVTAQKVLCQW